MKGQVAVVLTSLLVQLSCSTLDYKEGATDGLIGVYAYTEEGVVEIDGKAEKYLQRGTLKFSRRSADEIFITGPWNTIGTVRDGTVELASCHRKDRNGSINYTFGQMKKDGSTITFDYDGNGELTDNDSNIHSVHISGIVTAGRLSNTTTN